MAAETGTGQSMYEVEKYTNVNVIGTSHMLEILANSNHNVKKIIVACPVTVNIDVIFIRRTFSKDRNRSYYL